LVITIETAKDLTSMANHPSALKRHLQSVKKNARNRSARAALATQVKKARAEITEKKAEPNQGEVKKAVSLLARSGSKGILHKKTVARRISRLMKQANSK
jgi:small subunit ribosomal protein S20